MGKKMSICYRNWLQPILVSLLTLLIKPYLTIIISALSVLFGFIYSWFGQNPWVLPIAIIIGLGVFPVTLGLRLLRAEQELRAAKDSLAKKTGELQSRQDELKTAENKMRHLEAEVAANEHLPAKAGTTGLHLNTLKHDVIGTAHSGAQPIIANVAVIHANSFTNSRGTVVELAEYMRLLEQSAQYHELHDVTFIAQVKPSDWWCKEEEDDEDDNDDVKGLAWDYLGQLANIKADKDKPKIRMRRILLLDQESYDAEKYTDSKKTELSRAFTYFVNKHRDAKIDLLHLLPTEKLRDDQAVFVGRDDTRVGWIVKSDYKYTKSAAKNTPVKLQLECRPPRVSDLLRELYRTIRDLYNSYPGDVQGEFPVRITQEGFENFPDPDDLKTLGL